MSMALIFSRRGIVWKNKNLGVQLVFWQVIPDVYTFAAASISLVLS